MSGTLSFTYTPKTSGVGPVPGRSQPEKISHKNLLLICIVDATSIKFQSLNWRTQLLLQYMHPCKRPRMYTQTPAENKTVPGIIVHRSNEWQVKRKAFPVFVNRIASFSAETIDLMFWLVILVMRTHSTASNKWRRWNLSRSWYKVCILNWDIVYAVYWDVLLDGYWLISYFLSAMYKLQQKYLFQP
jgi:hypothetical protein